MALTIIPKRIRLTEDVPDAFKKDTIPLGSVGEILIEEWTNGRRIWFVQFFLEGGVERHADVFPDQAEMLDDED